MIGPPNWNQLVYIGGGYPYYRPNSVLIEAIFWLIACLVISIGAALVLRRARRRKDAVSIIRELLNFKYYWSAMLFSIITYGYAVIDNAIHIGVQYVQQRYFLVRLIFNAFDYAGRIFLLFTIYALVFRLMRKSPLHIHGHAGDQAAQRKKEKRIQRASRRRNPAKANGSRGFSRNCPRDLSLAGIIPATNLMSRMQLGNEIWWNVG